MSPLCFPCVALLFLATPALAITWFVGPEGAPGNDGNTWATALSHPAQAAARAQAGDEIWVATGHYAGESIRLPAGVALLGGFAGTETEASQTTGDPALTILETTSKQPVVEVLNPGATTPDNRISGFTFQAAGDAAATGRGVVIKGGSLQLRGNVFRWFKAVTPFDQAGAAVQAVDCALTLEDNLFHDNLAAGDGAYGAGLGARRVQPLLIRGNEFRHNRAAGAVALALRECHAEISGNRLVGNVGGDTGYPGAVELHTCAFIFTRNRLLFNRGGASSGVFIFNAMEGMTNEVGFNLFAGNLSTGQLNPGVPGGALAVFNGGPVTVLNNTFVGNAHAPLSGTVGQLNSAGGVGSVNSSLLLANNLFVRHRRAVDAPGAVLHRNFFHDNEDDFIRLQPHLTASDAVADPQFVGGMRALDFHLAAPSPARGFGDPDLVPLGTLDLAGRPAHDESGVSVGALAYNPERLAPPPLRVIHLRPDGDDAAAGDSWATAMKSLPAAAARVAWDEATELWFTGGRFEGGGVPGGLPPTLTLRGGFTGTENSPSERPRTGGPETVLSRGPAGALLHFVHNGPWNEVERFTFDGTPATAEAEVPFFGGGLLAEGSWPWVHHCRFVHNRSHNHGAALWAEGGRVTDCVFEQNSAGTNRFPWASIVYFRGGMSATEFQRNLVRNNVVTNTQASITLFGIFSGVISHNAWLDNQALGTPRSGQGTVMMERPPSTVVPFEFRHNTLVGNTSEGAGFWAVAMSGQPSGSPRLRFEANLVAHNVAGISLHQTSAASATNNLFFANGDAAPQFPPPAALNLQADPRLAEDRLHLTAESPARDAATAALEVAARRDIDGQGAFLGSAPDLGADEFLPAHPLAAAVAAAEAELDPVPRLVRGRYRNLESTCPDCYTREFSRSSNGFELELHPQENCPLVPCLNEPEWRDYPFELGTIRAGTHPLRVWADGLLLRTLPLTVLPPVQPHLEILPSSPSPRLLLDGLPGVSHLLDTSMDLMTWEPASRQLPGFQALPQTNELQFLRARRP